MHFNFISVFLFFSLCAFGSTLSIYDAFGFVPSVALSPWMSSMGMTRNETQSGAPQNLQGVIKSAFASQSAASFKAQSTGQGSMPPAVSPCCGPHCIIDGCLAEIPQKVSKSVSGSSMGCCGDKSDCANPTEHCIEQDNAQPPIPNGGSGGCCSDKRLCGPNEHCSEQAGVMVTVTSGTEETGLPSTTSNETSSEATPTTTDQPQHSNAGGTSGCCKDKNLCGPNQHCIAGQVVTITSLDGTSSVASQTTTCGPQKSTEGGSGGCCEDESLCGPNQHCIGGQAVTFTTSLGPVHSIAGGTGGCCKDQSQCGPGEHCINQEVVTLDKGLDEMGAEAVQISTAVVDSSSTSAAATASSTPIQQSAMGSSQAEHPQSALRLPVFVEAAKGAPVSVLAKMSPESAENLVTREALRDLRREGDIGVGFRSGQYIALSVMAGAHQRIHLGREFTIVDGGDAGISIGSTLLRDMGMLAVDSQRDHSSTPELKLQSP